MIGALMSPILVQMEETLMGYEANVGLKPCYSEKAFRAVIKLFTSVLLDKMWELQNREDMSEEDRLNMANKLGEEVRKMVKVYTNIDTHTLYETE